eukprot:2447397-Pleurochrysis_carterae.AAC.1
MKPSPLLRSTHEGRISEYEGMTNLGTRTSVESRRHARAASRAAQSRRGRGGASQPQARLERATWRLPTSP